MSNLTASKKIFLGQCNTGILWAMQRRWYVYLYPGYTMSYPVPRVLFHGRTEHTKVSGRAIQISKKRRVRVWSSYRAHRVGCGCGELTKVSGTGMRCRTRAEHAKISGRVLISYRTHYCARYGYECLPKPTEVSGTGTTRVNTPGTLLYVPYRTQPCSNDTRAKSAAPPRTADRRNEIKSARDEGRTTAPGLSLIHI